MRRYLFIVALCASAFAQNGIVPVPPVFLGPAFSPRLGASLTISFCTSTATLLQCTGGAAYAQAYSDSTNSFPINQATNPLKTDALGNPPAFYAAPGQYSFAVSGPGIAAPQGPYQIFVSCIPGTTCVSTGANNAFTGNNTHSGTETFTNGISSNSAAINGPLTAPFVDGIVYMDCSHFPCTDTGLSSALSAAGTNGTVIIPSNQTIALTSNHIISTNGQTILCAPNAGFSSSTSTGQFTVSGANDIRISGCTFTWSSGGPGGFVEIANTVSRIQIDHNVFLNDVNSGAGTSVVFVGDRTNNATGKAVTDVWVDHNRFVGNTANNINVQDQVQRAHIEDNSVTSPSSGSAIIINAQNTDSSTVISDMTIARNVMFVGNAECIQVQQLTSLVLQGVVVADNVCRLQSGGTGGTCYSLVGINGATETGNLCDFNGQTFASGNAPFEWNNITNGAQTGNTVLLGSQSGGAPLGFSIIGNNSSTTSNNVHSGNSVSVAYTGTGSGECYLVATGVGNNVIRETFAGNTCDLTGSTGKMAGLFMQANGAGGAISNNLVAHNTFIGTGVTGDCGICLELDAGTMAHNVVGPNTVFNFHLPYGQSYASQTANLALSTLDPYPVGAGGSAISVVNLLWSSTLPSITSGFNGGAIGTGANGTAAFRVIIGGGGGVSTGVLSMPTTTTAWQCFAQNLSRADLVLQTAASTNSVTLTNFGTTFAATNWSGGDNILIHCDGT